MSNAPVLDTPSSSSEAARTIAAYPAWARAALALVVLWRWMGVWLVSALVVWASDPPVTPPILLQLFALYVALPWVLEHALRWPFRARGYANASALVLDFRTYRLEIPRGRIECVRPWRLPLPGPGLLLLDRGGAPLRERVEVDSPLSWARAHQLALSRDVDRSTRATVAFAEARAARPQWEWYHYAIKFLLFALLPAALLFQVHQHIAYGSLWGEYYQRGWQAYLQTWCVYYGTVVLYLVLFAGLVRFVVELLLWLAAYVAPERAPRARDIGEVVTSALYYFGALSLLALRFSGCG